MAMDSREHEKTYNGFIKATKWGTAIVILIVIFVVYIIT
ncbi:MAG: aa3-type cytochrome c oxidase subunit IV [Pseudomonadota bacterium]